MPERDADIKYSIVLPTYNVANYIDRCIESCLAQNYKNFEVIVVDDCGTDNSIEKAERWAEQDNRIRILRNSRNLGTYHTRKNGAEAATGEYILFLDPDDAIHNYALSIINDSLKEHPADLIIYGVAESLKKKTKINLPKDCSSNEEIIDNLIQKTRSLGYGTAGKAFCKAVLDRAYARINANTKDRLVYAEDVLLFYAAALFSQSSISIPIPLYIYHREPNSITIRNNIDDIEFKTSQIHLVASYIHRIIGSSSDIPELSKDAGKKIVGKILSDAALIKRNTKRKSGKDQYTSCVYESLRMRGGYADIIRLATFILSAGLVRL